MELSELQCGDKVEILWNDIISDSEWHIREEVAKVKPARCSYVGYFLDKDDECVRCMNMQSFGDGGCDYSIFPLGVITKVNLLKKGENGTG